MICTTHQNIIRMIKSKRMRWMAHVAGVRDSGGAYRVLVRRPDSTWKIYMDGPKSNENDFLRRAVGPGKDSGGRGRWRRNPGIQFDLTQVSPRLCSSRYVNKVRSCFCVLSRAKMQRSVEQCYAIKFCAKLGKAGSETLQLLRTAYGDAVLSLAQVFRWH